MCCWFQWCRLIEQCLRLAIQWIQEWTRSINVLHLWLNTAPCVCWTWEITSTCHCFNSRVWQITYSKFNTVQTYTLLSQLAFETKFLKRAQWCPVTTASSEGAGQMCISLWLSGEAGSGRESGCQAQCAPFWCALPLSNIIICKPYEHITHTVAKSLT